MRRDGGAVAAAVATGLVSMVVTFAGVMSAAAHVLRILGHG